MVLCWSGNYIAAKVVFREMPATLVMCLRTVVAAVLMIPILWAQQRRRPFAWTWREFSLVATLGVGGIVLNQFFWTLSVERTTVVHSSMIMATTPLFVLLMATSIRLEKLTLPKAGGIIVALIGMLLLQFSHAQGAGKGPTLLGDFLSLLCTLALATMTVLGKLRPPQSGGIAVNAVGYILGSFFLFPLFLSVGRNFDYARVSGAAWAGIFYMGTFSSVTGYLIFYYALDRISASRMATFQYLQPVFASVLALTILGEELNAVAIAAGAIILAGVYVTEQFG